LVTAAVGRDREDLGAGPDGQPAGEPFQHGDHISNILAKLGLSSRVELATLVARRAG
jgi:hypothetical protein